MMTNSYFTANSFCSIDSKQVQIYKIRIQGTTFSGHPTRTTLGNTLRTLSFVTFQVYMSYGEQTARDFFFSELEEIFAYIAGDDVQVTGLEEYINEVARNCEKTHAPDANVGVYGLG